MLQLKEPANLDQVRAAFKVFDKKGSGNVSAPAVEAVGRGGGPRWRGQIDAKELKHVLSHLGARLTESEVDAIFKEVRPPSSSCA